MKTDYDIALDLFPKFGEIAVGIGNPNSARYAGKLYIDLRTRPTEVVTFWFNADKSALHLRPLTLEDL